MSPGDVHISNFEATHGGYKCKDDCEVKTAETQQLMKHGNAFY
jgi:hypothetical protein